MIKNNQKEYCANNLSRIVINKICEENPDIRRSKLISDFMDSKTYDLLYDFKTGLWAEGPGYIYYMYKEETKK